MITFFDNGLSPFAQKVKMALIEKGIEFHRVVPDLSMPDEGFLRASALREVPALVDDGVSLFESGIIVEYLEDKWPEPRILSADPHDRARCRLVQSVCDSQLEAVIFGMTEFIAFKRDDGELASSMLARAREDVAHLMQWLSVQLADRLYFNGSTFGLGDMAALPYISTLALYKMGPAADSRLGQWFERCRVRPSFQRCLQDAKAELADFKQAAQRIQTGQWPRQYRNHRLDWFMRSGGARIVSEGHAVGTIRFSHLPHFEQGASR